MGFGQGPAPARKLTQAGTPAQTSLAPSLCSTTRKKISSTEIRRTPDKITDRVSIRVIKNFPLKEALSRLRQAIPKKGVLKIQKYY